MLINKILDAYSNLHTHIECTNSDKVSFEGSQIQKEFFEAWDCISEYYRSNPVKELTFLEVGAWKGLWGIAFAEFCILNKIKGTYVTITMIDQDPNNQPLYKSLDYIRSLGLEATLIDKNTLDESALPEVLKFSNSYNIVFIDADHSYEAVLNDIEKFSSLATDILLFHDIRPKAVMRNFGVYQAIVDSNISLDKEIVSNENAMGIGIKFIKNVNSNT